jgi:hypothetical protein
VYNKGTLEEIQKMENELARWGTRTPRGTASMAIRHELGWNSVENEEKKRKLAFYERVKRMDSTRWPKIMVEEMEKGRWAGKWHERIKEIMEEWRYMTNHHSAPGMNEVKRIINHKAWMEEISCMEKQRVEMRSLKWYQHTLRRGEPLPYLDRSKEAGIVCKLRTGGVRWANINGIDKKMCRLCKGEENPGEHIMVKCRKIEQLRDRVWKEIGKERRDGENDEEWTRRLLSDTTKENVRGIARVYEGYREEVVEKIRMEESRILIVHTDKIGNVVRVEAEVEDRDGNRRIEEILGSSVDTEDEREGEGRTEE